MVGRLVDMRHNKVAVLQMVQNLGTSERIIDGRGHGSWRFPVLFYFIIPVRFCFVLSCGRLAPRVVPSVTYSGLPMGRPMVSHGIFPGASLAIISYVLWDFPPKTANTVEHSPLK